MAYDRQNKYEDMLHLPHPVSTVHPQMPVQDRAAQFAPFAALTGHGAAIKEAERLTEERVELEEDTKEEINAALQWIREHISTTPQVTITYFKPDTRKTGGAYLTLQGNVRKLDEYEHTIILTQGHRIPIEDIRTLEV